MSLSVWMSVCLSVRLSVCLYVQGTSYKAINPRLIHERPHGVSCHRVGGCGNAAGVYATCCCLCFRTKQSPHARPMTDYTNIMSPCLSACMYVRPSVCMTACPMSGRDRRWDPCGKRWPYAAICSPYIAFIFNPHMFLN